MCLNPRQVVVPAFPTGRKIVTVPCGHCLECLKRKQDDITIRIIEESKNWPRLVFFTLTYNDDSVHEAQVSAESLACQLYETGAFDPETGFAEVAEYDPLSPESRAYLENNDYRVKQVCAKDFSETVKRFRESFVAAESVRRGIPRKAVKRLNFKYFYTTEYGPRTLRPHGHGVIWFDFPEHYIHDLFSDWRSRFGYVKYDILSTPSINAEDVERISRYVGKYCSKGVFESPLVKDGVAPKCTRLFSKGVGLSYVEKMRDWHLGISDGLLPYQAYFYGSVSIPLSKPSAYGGFKNFKRYVVFIAKNSLRYALCIRSAQASLERLCDRCKYVLNTRGQVFSYHLPRYYKDKIYGAKSILSYSLSDAVVARFRKDCERKFLAYKHSHPNLSDFQVLFALYRQDLFVAEQRARIWHERSLNHYSKSKI